ncbi:MAG: helix-turn-helix transcriptional regulator [Paludibacteraceae bacterium]|nr:helix-turn-helix transcriptional regulator [Paludibacteraceae bacterium]
MNISLILRTNTIKCLSDRKMSQIELAVASGLHESVISRLLSGKREFNGYHIQQIAKAFNLSVTNLMYYPIEIVIAQKVNNQLIFNLGDL